MTSPADTTDLALHLCLRRAGARWTGTPPIGAASGDARTRMLDAALVAA